ncbi:hypothetical protein EX30DRAFT_311518 [Ascodesmis nigricans]|uniref:chitin synthase n=1 Tax=Ascodesmis nigricans TaxID=341454 RepID=A0A4S2MK85_9PEZI|nr:hypothetical protein EX30DRAFT_311518 [Ascodesmis nigricans]
MSFSNNRHSIYSNASASPFQAIGGQQQPGNITTSALLNALHNSYVSGTPYPLDATTTLVVNSGNGQGSGSFVATIDEEIGTRAWEHARRRAEDQTIILASLHSPAPSLLNQVLSTVPAPPDLLLSSVALVQAFTSCLTPFSPYALPRHRGLAVALEFSLTGAVIGARIALSTAGLDLENGLLHIPAKPGYRAFDVFYYLLSAVTTPTERQGLGLGTPESYTLLSRSNTYTAPNYLPTADDCAAAEDWRANLRAVGIKGSTLRGLLSVLAGILKLGNSVGLLVDEEVIEDVCDDVAELLGVETEVLAKKMSDNERELFIGVVYEMLVEWVISKVNDALSADFSTRKEIESEAGDSQADPVQVTVLELPDEKISRAICLKAIFDEETGLNLEMKADGVEVPPVSSTVIREMRSAWTEAEQSGLVGMSREREYEQDRREQIIEKGGREVEDDGFLKEVLFPEEYGRSRRTVQTDVLQFCNSSRAWYHLSVSPSDEEITGPQPQQWSAAAVSRQLRTWRLPEWANRRIKRLDFTADLDYEEFAIRYGPLGCSGGHDGVENWVLERGWSNGEVALGNERVWLREPCWWESESMLDMKQPGVVPAMMGMGAGPMDTGFTANTNGSSYFPAGGMNAIARDPLLGPMDSTQGPFATPVNDVSDRNVMSKYEANHYQGISDPEVGEPTKIEERPSTRSRKLWVFVVWALTFWIPSFVLRYVGRMKRPDVRMAWREKVVLFSSIVVLNAAIVFWIAFFAPLLCPDIDKAWSLDQVARHQGENDFWVGIHGQIYDLTKFYKLPHGSIKQGKATKETMLEFAGKDLSQLFPKQIHLACPALIDQDQIGVDRMQFVYNDSSIADLNPAAVHKSGYHAPDPTSKLADPDWFATVFLEKMKDYKKGTVVWERKKLRKIGSDYSKPWAIINDNVYDLTDYFKTFERLEGMKTTPNLEYIDDSVEELFQANPGEDITELFYKNDKITDAQRKDHLDCLNNLFKIGIVDFRNSARCQASGYVLLAAAAMMASVIVVKFLAALQLGSKRRPAMQDKFVICQVPAYTEGEDSLRKALDSLTALNYDNKRKLICVICDGMVVGGGNDRPTPNIVLEILGVDPKIDPPALPFKSVGDGSDQLNYGKVYSGLYEYEGCVVPYIVVVKVGKPSEAAKSKPGNRGKRDSQVLLLEFLNRVHHRTPMSPLQLEMFHQINNIIGVDPELYEYLLMVDADTSVKEDSLNRLVAACAHDAKIVGICGETSLENEERSWWTMIQVYEYYISHHLAKSFESLFGSVTCLPGCFCMYRLRTADKGRPLIISSKVIEEYSDGIVDTLHKKNLLSLGEDRYLTTLMMKHFPFMSMKFIPDAYANTAAPESWSVLLSQRRRWINSTIHNLAELVFLEEMCGFCCFSMRFVVLLDLVGTIILPATCVYIGYLIYMIATKTGPFPYLSLGMIAGVYGLQALIFIIKRRWQHIGWMIIYLLAFPIHAFILPVYSFWAQDDFSWGNTRIVVGEKGGKKIIASTEEEGFDPRSIPLQTWDDYAAQNNLPGRRGGVSEKFTSNANYDDNAYEMDDMHSMYSSVKPASTVLTGLPQMGGQPYMPPQSPAPFGGNVNRHSQMSLGGMSSGDYWQDGPRNRRSSPMSTTDNLIGMQTPPPRAPTRSPLGFDVRRSSQMDFMRAGGPDDESITEAIRQVLREIDLETVTKKQVRYLVEQRLQTECQGERRAFMDRQIDAELANMPM